MTQRPITWLDKVGVTKRLNHLLRLLETGGEVNVNRAQIGLLNASAVAVILEGEFVCSMGALKSHSTGQAKAQAAKYKAQELQDVTLELGYIATESRFGEKGLSSSITDALLAKTNDSVLATVRTTNAKMTGMLQRRGFAAVGEPTDSQMNPGEHVQAYLRPAVT